MVQMLEAVFLQLNYKFLTRPIEFVGLQRVEKDQYPIDALREMLLNAMVHQTYMGAPVQLRVYDNRLSIWNEGILPMGLSLSDLKIEYNSRPRNPKIAESCFLAGYIDVWGRGTLKIINSCKEAGLADPEIKEINGGVEVTIYNDLQPDFSEGFRKEFGKDAAATYRVILNHPEFNAIQIANEISKTPRTVENYLAKLKAAGFIVRKGQKLGGHWEFIDVP